MQDVRFRPRNTYNDVTNTTFILTVKNAAFESELRYALQEKLLKIENFRCI